ASRTIARNASSSRITWSAANDPMIPVGSSRSIVAAASPIAAIQAAGGGSSRRRAGGRRLGDHLGGCQVGQLAAYRGLVRGTGDHEDPLADQREQPVDRGLQQRAPGAAEGVQAIRLLSP